MKKSVILFMFSFSFILPFITCGQEKDTTSQPIDKTNYTDYYKYIEQARKKAYREKDYKQALILFKKSFASVEYVFLLDLEQALEIAIEAKDNYYTYELCKQLIIQGCPIEYFDNSLFKNKLDKKSTEWQMIEKSYEEWHAIYKENLHQELREKVFELRQMDSILNVEFHTAPQSADYIIAQTTKIHDEFIRMVEEYGFPSEQKVGAIFNEDFKINSLIVGVIFVHQYQFGSRLMEAEMDELILKGKIDRTEYNLFSKFKYDKTMKEVVEHVLKIKWELSKQ